MCTLKMKWHYERDHVFYPSPFTEVLMVGMVRGVGRCIFMRNDVLIRCTNIKMFLNHGDGGNHHVSKLLSCRNTEVFKKLSLHFEHFSCWDHTLTCTSDTGDCVLPFTFNEITYHGCTNVDHDQYRCQTGVDEDGEMIWGNCNDVCPIGISFHFISCFDLFYAFSGFSKSLGFVQCPHSLQPSWKADFAKCFYKGFTFYRSAICKSIFCWSF